MGAVGKAGIVGFDLDMTLVDSADGIVASIQYVCAGYGVEPSAQEIRQTIGLPLDMVFPAWLPDEPYDVLLAAYRAHYRENGVPLTVAMPGAAQAIADLRAAGDAVMVVTAKHEPVAALALAAAGLDADIIVGDRFAEAKGESLLEHGAWAYVGDHVGDLRAARVAGAHAIAVATGPTSAEELRAYGADVVLDSLHDLGGWLTDRRG